MPEHSESELPEPRSTEETTEELEEMRERMQEGLFNFLAKEQKLAGEINREANLLELSTFFDASLDLSQRGENDNPGVGIADAQDAAAEEVIKELRIKLEKATMKLAEAPNAAKEFNLQRFLLFNGLLATAGAIAALLYTAIRDVQNGKPTPPELPEDTAAKVRQLVRAWNAEPDATYWTDLATYVSLPDQKPKLTLADQILFMSYTIDLSPASQTWLWDSAADVAALVDKLVDAYNGGQTTAAMYRLAATLTYRNTPIPRGVMAYLLRAALSEILVILDPGTPVFADATLLGGEPGEEDPLSEPPDDPQADADKEAEEARKEKDSFAARNAESARNIAAEVETLAVTTLNCDNVELSQTEPVEVPNSAVADPTPDPRLQELDAALTRALDRVAAKADTASRQSNVTRYLARFFGISVLAAAAVVLLEYLTRSAKGQPTDDLPPVPKETQASIHDLVEKWKDEDDAHFWESLAGYLEKDPKALTGADQVLFMNYTIDLCPPAEPFIWDSQKDKAAVVDGLVGTSRDGADMPALYRALPALKYQDKPVPRAVAAECARLAVAWISGKTLPPLDNTAAVAPTMLVEDVGRGITGIPEQLRPRIYVAEVASGVNREAYARSLHWLFRPAGLDDPVMLSAAATYWQPSTSPYQLLDPARQIAALPATARESVTAMVAALTEAIEAVYPLPATETQLSSQITCLAEPVFDLPAGTVVYMRTTDRATVLFVLPRVVVDPQTGVPSLRRLVAVTPPEPPPTAAGARLGNSAVSIALSVAGNLAWAMPPPWGAVTSAGFTLIQLLLADGNSTDQFSQVVKELELFIQQRDVNHDANTIKSLADWLQEQMYLLGTTPIGDSEPYITTGLLPELRRMVSPGDGSVYAAIADLEQNLDVPGAFDILVLGVTIYVLALKMIVQLDAQLASIAKQNGDIAAFSRNTDLWLADYTNFLTAINGYSQNGTTTAGWAVRVYAHISAFKDARLSQISEPYRYNAQKWVVVTGGGATGTAGYWVDDWGWTYKDRAAGDTDATNFVGDDDDSGDCCGNGKRHTEYRANVKQAQLNRVQSVSDELDKKYVDAVSTVKTWISMIQQWNEHLPPRPPTTAVRIDGWNDKAQGNWKDGESVSYAVAFANASGPSHLGPWCTPVPTTTNAFPTLTDLPTDPLKMATFRWIYRQFVTSDGTKTPMRIVAITDATSARYVDKAQ